MMEHPTIGLNTSIAIANCRSQDDAVNEVRRRNELAEKRRHALWW